jgi:hypothetical protein
VQDGARVFWLQPDLPAKGWDGNDRPAERPTAAALGAVASATAAADAAAWYLAQSLLLRTRVVHA